MLRDELAEGDRIEVFDWFPRTGREKWQMATVTEVADGQILYRLDVAPVLTSIPVDSKYWRQSR